jgi:hypothetical protein
MIRRTVMGRTPRAELPVPEAYARRSAVSCGNAANPLIYLDKNYRKLLINLTNKMQTHPGLGGFAPAFDGLHLG